MRFIKIIILLLISTASFGQIGAMLGHTKKVDTSAYQKAVFYLNKHDSVMKMQRGKSTSKYLDSAKYWMNVYRKLALERRRKKQ